MEAGYKPYHFHAYEVVPQRIYNEWGKLSFRFVNSDILKAADRLREKYGPAVINDWYWGGNNDSRGYRYPEDTDGSPLSAHKRSEALDMVFKSADVEKIRRDILANPNKREYEYITAIEMEVEWLHISCENLQRITKIYPK